jgi:hypothetical protein
MELVCQLCKEKYELIQEEKHYKSKCSYFHKIDCHFCEERLVKNEMIAHTKEAHADKFEEIVNLLYENPKPMLNPYAVINQKKKYLEVIGRNPQLGTTGKFYCGGKL